MERWDKVYNFRMSSSFELSKSIQLYNLLFNILTGVCFLQVLLNLYVPSNHAKFLVLEPELNQLLNGENRKTSLKITRSTKRCLRFPISVFVTTTFSLTTYNYNSQNIRFEQENALKN
jgi:hypothetical protein